MCEGDVVVEKLWIVFACAYRVSFKINLVSVNMSANFTKNWVARGLFRAS